MLVSIFNAYEGFCRVCSHISRNSVDVATQVHFATLLKNIVDAYGTCACGEDIKTCAIAQLAKLIVGWKRRQERQQQQPAHQSNPSLRRHPSSHGTHLHLQFFDRTRSTSPLVNPHFGTGPQHFEHPSHVLGGGGVGGASGISISDSFGVTVGDEADLSDQEDAALNLVPVPRPRVNSADDPSAASALPKVGDARRDWEGRNGFEFPAPLQPRRRAAARGDEGFGVGVKEGYGMRQCSIFIYFLAP